MLLSLGVPSALSKTAEVLRPFAFSCNFEFFLPANGVTPAPRTAQGCIAVYYCRCFRPATEGSAADNFWAPELGLSLSYYEKSAAESILLLRRLSEESLTMWLSHLLRRLWVWFLRLRANQRCSFCMFFSATLFSK